MNKRGRLIRRISELHELILICQTTKNKLKIVISRLNSDYRSGAIDPETLAQELSRILKGRALEQWLSYYDSCIEYYTKEIKKAEEQLRALKIKKRVLSFLVLFSLIFISFFFFKAELTGLFILEEANEYSETISLTFDKNAEFTWQPETQGILESVKLSGEVSGEGNAKVYLDNLLVLDTSLLKNENKSETKTASLTGLAVQETLNEAGSTISDETEKPASSFSEKEETVNEGIEQTEETNETESLPENLPEENITQQENTSQPEDITAPRNLIEEPIEKVETKFSDICVETCDLTGLVFNKSSYKIRVELENVTLKLANAFGVINLTQPVNLTKYENTTTNEINLDEYMNISYNRIFLNSSFLTDFSSIPSTLKLYSLNFTNPRILKDGAVCSAPTCVIESYSFDSYSQKGSLIFNVTGFSVYSAEETPTETPAQPPTGGGGGGGVVAKPKKQIEFNQTSMKLSLKQGETKQVYLKIKNSGGSTLNVKLSPSFEIKEFVKFREDEFQLKANEEKEIEIDAVTKEKTAPEIYIGKIIAESGAIREEVMFAIEVESKGAIFDVALEIPEQFKEVWAGESIFAKIKIYSLERVGLVDVNLSYEIRDSQGVVISSEKEMSAIETQISLSREIKISEKAEPGEYVFYVKVEYARKIGSASESFKVIALEKPFFTSKRIIIFIVIITVIFIGIIIYELSRIRKLVQKYKEVNEMILYKTKLIKNRRTS